MALFGKPNYPQSPADYVSHDANHRYSGLLTRIHYAHEEGLISEIDMEKLETVVKFGNDWEIPAIRRELDRVVKLQHQREKALKIAVMETLGLLENLLGDLPEMTPLVCEAVNTYRIRLNRWLSGENRTEPIKFAHLYTIEDEIRQIKSVITQSHGKIFPKEYQVTEN